MTTFQDCSIGFGVESTFGTSVTPARWLEFTDENLQLNKNIKQGEGLRVSSRVARSARRTIPTYDVTGDVTIEALSKGMGLWLQALLGAGTANTLTPSGTLQVFTLADVMPSLTVQRGLPNVSGTVSATTFSGVTCSSAKFQWENADIVKITGSLDGAQMSTGTAYAAPSYATGGTLFTFAGATISTGTLTPPTTTALATAATPIANIRSGDLTIDHNLTTDRYNIGGTPGGTKARQPVGLRQITGTLTAEYTDNTLRDAIIADTPMSVLLTWVSLTNEVNDTPAALQIALPEVKLDGDLPTSNGGQLITYDCKMTVLDNLSAAQPIWVVYRTSDTAL